jgi:hypothetical protein
MDFALTSSMHAHSRSASGAELGRVSPKGGSAFPPNMGYLVRNATDDKCIRLTRPAKLMSLVERYGYSDIAAALRERGGLPDPNRPI